MTLTTNEIRQSLLAWIHDLETTDAKQGKKALRTLDDSYCCLGRAALVLGRALDIREHTHSTDAEVPKERYAYAVESGRTFGSILAREDAERFGLTCSEADECWHMNDSGDKTFPEIATWLRVNVLARYSAEGSVDHSVTETVAS